MCFLSGMSVSDLRLRFLQLKYINQQLSLLLPAIDLRSSHPLSLGARLSRLSPLLFYNVKLTFLHAVLDASTRRSLDQAPPEIKMDPLESLTGVCSCVSRQWKGYSIHSRTLLTATSPPSPPLSPFFNPPSPPSPPPSSPLCVSGCRCVSSCCGDPVL